MDVKEYLTASERIEEFGATISKLKEKQQEYLNSLTIFEVLDLMVPVFACKMDNPHEVYLINVVRDPEGDDIKWEREGCEPIELSEMHDGIHYEDQNGTLFMPCSHAEYAKEEAKNGRGVEEERVLLEHIRNSIVITYGTINLLKGETPEDVRKSVDKGI